MNKLKKLYWWLFVIKLSLRWIPRLNIGDLVTYNGHQYTLIDGVRRTHWTLKGHGLYFDAPTDRLIKVATIKNYIHSFKSGYSFYMDYWYNLWVYEGIKPWMKSCNIWGR